MGWSGPSFLGGRCVRCRSWLGMGLSQTRGLSKRPRRRLNRPFPLVSRAPSVPDPPLPLTPTYPVPCLEKSSRSFIMIWRSKYRHMNRRFHNDAFLGRPRADQVGRRVQKARASGVHCGSMQDLKLRKQSYASNLLLDLWRISFKSLALFNRYLSSFCRISFIQITSSGFY